MFKRLTYPVITSLLLAAAIAQPAFALDASPAKAMMLADATQIRSTPQSTGGVKLDQARQIDEARMLRADNKRLRAEIQNLSQQLIKLQNEKLFCSNNTTSSNKAGVNTDCTPYACNYTPGACLTRAVSSNDCAGGYNWLEDGRCVNCPDGYHKEKDGRCVEN